MADSSLVVVSALYYDSPLHGFYVHIQHFHKSQCNPYNGLYKFSPIYIGVYPLISKEIENMIYHLCGQNAAAPICMIQIIESLLTPQQATVTPTTVSEMMIVLDSVIALGAKKNITILKTDIIAAGVCNIIVPTSTKPISHENNTIIGWIQISKTSCGMRINHVVLAENANKYAVAYHMIQHLSTDANFGPYVEQLNEFAQTYNIPVKPPKQRAIISI